MNVTTPTSAPPSAASSALAGATGSSEMGRDEFLQLLVAQLRNQDPTSPQDGHEFAAQLAQFSSVEQLTNIGSTLSSQSGQLTALAQALDGVQSGQSALAERLSGRMDLQAAASLIGQSVEVASGAVEWSGEGAVPVTVRLAAGVREVEVTLRDADGAVVRTLKTGGLGAGDHDVAWDGTLADGSVAPAGAYTASVTAVGADGKPADATPVLRGAVGRLSVEGDGVFLWIGGRKVPFSSLLSVASSTPVASGAQPPELSQARSPSPTFLPMR